MREFKGSFQTARQIFDSDIFVNKPDKWFKIWIFILGICNHQDSKGFSRGETLTTYYEIEFYTKSSKNTTKHCLAYLRKALMITTHRTTRGIRIKVLKYDYFQSFDTYRTPKIDLKAPQKALQVFSEKPFKSPTIVKNDNNVNNTETLSSLNYLKDIPKEDIEQFRHQFKCDISNIKTKANSLYDYCKAKGRVYKNYKAFLSNALRKDFGERTQPLVIRDEKVIIEEDRTPEEQERINKSLEKVRQVLKL